MYKEMRPYLNLFYNIEYGLPQTITKIKQEIDYDVTTANVHQVKTAPLFHKLPTTGKDIMLTLVTHLNIIFYKKRLWLFIYLFIRFPATKYRYKYIKKESKKLLKGKTYKN